jgi:glutathione S-transferase
MVSRDPFKSAQMAQLIKVVELYIANASGRVVGSAFFGQDLNEEVAADSRSQVQRGLAALDRLGSFSPYIMGEEISMADFFAYYIFASARPIARRVWGWDIVAEVDGLGDWLKLMSGRPMVQQVNAEFNDAVAKIIL